ncbi:MAG: hypothetical protein Q9180_001180 [Flavoplaca navasiana]
MNAQSTSQPNLTSSRSHLSVNSQVSTVPISNRDPRDGFDYTDLGPSNTPSKKRAADPVSGSASQVSTDADNVLNPQQLDEKLHAATIYERGTRNTRARYPDGDLGSIKSNALLPSSRASSNLSSSSQKSRRNDRGHRNDRPIPSQPARATEKTKLRRVLLNWGKEHIDGSQRIVLNAALDAVHPAQQPLNSVLWQHSDHDNNTLEELEMLVSQLKSSGLQDSEVGLTKRLLKRVQLVTERAFVGGSFLSPTAIRYDMLNDSRYGGDKCCAFLNFPYLAVMRAQKTMAFGRGDSRHPTRTLLQSRYRLNETGDRDDSQCIRMLDARSLKSCIKDPRAGTTWPAGKDDDKLIYVPQLWALIMGRDRMVTVGPLSDQALEGSTIELRDGTVTIASQRCTLVRISFLCRGIPEEVTYPLEQCASWFGLLNKHQEIRNALRRGKEKAAPNEYPLYVGQHRLSGTTWASVQRAANGDILELWMETPKPPKVKLNNTDGESASEAGQASGAEDEPLEERRTSDATSTVFKKLDEVPIVKPFLEWRVLDDFGEIDGYRIDQQASRFLNAIYWSLPAICSPEVSDPGPQSASGKRTVKSPGSSRPKISIQGKSRQDADSLAFERSYNKKGSSVEQDLYRESSRLLACFVSKGYDKDAAPIRLYWGLVHKLMQDHLPYLHSLLDMIRDVNGWAELLHIGVHFQRPKQVSSQEVDYQDDNVDSAILQASMVDALGAIYNLLVEVLRVASLGSHNRGSQRLALGKRATGYGNEAGRLLETARNDLITEATGTAPGENVGPVVTPEAILIMIMERLARGVFGTGSVDVINILEECLEQLALRVEKHSSRRLLQKLNAFEEEVDIVSDVLLQQIKVLSEFRDCLDPGNFKRPTTARKMRFEFENQGIERILVHINEQLRHCKELRERAKVLAVQNVQLVETFADDNSRALFVFTFITVLFLPLSFVAGFFGMNLAGIADTESRVTLFWYTALPLTAGILIMCILFIARGESIWFAVADLLESSLSRGKRKKRSA